MTEWVCREREGLAVKCLVVAAHPDDEVLGAGAFMYRLSQRGGEVSVCLMDGNARARSARPDDAALEHDLSSSTEKLGISRVFRGDFPNIQMNTVPHLRMVQFIEKAVEESGAELVITHYPGYTNNDHLQTSLACQAAIRLFQRRPEVKPIREFWFMEVPSATDWGVNQALRPFTPNTFIEVGQEGIQRKLDALGEYRGVMRPYPHPRSAEALMGLAAYRGAQAGVMYAEAFECAFRRGTLTCRREGG